MIYESNIFGNPLQHFYLFCYVTLSTECCLCSIFYFSLFEILALTIQPGPSCHGFPYCLLLCSDCCCSSL